MLSPTASRSIRYSLKGNPHSVAAISRARAAGTIRDGPRVPGNRCDDQVLKLVSRSELYPRRGSLRRTRFQGPKSPGYPLVGAFLCPGTRSDGAFVRRTSARLGGHRRWCRTIAASASWADTRASPGRPMLAVLGGLAVAERDLTRTRTAERILTVWLSWTTPYFWRT
jgi:hypothetical protein